MLIIMNPQKKTGLVFDVEKCQRKRGTMLVWVNYRIQKMLVVVMVYKRDT